MLSDMTFGQYYPSESPVHRMDPRAKLLLLIVYIVAVFLAKNFYGLAVCLIFLLLAIAFSRVPVRSVLKSVKGIGDVKLKKLLKRWPTKPKLKTATAEELMAELKINEETAKALMEVIAGLN